MDAPGLKSHLGKKISLIKRGGGEGVFQTCLGLRTGKGAITQLIKAIRVQIGFQLRIPPVQPVPAGDQMQPAGKSQIAQGRPCPADIILKGDQIRFPVGPKQVNQLLGRNTPVPVHDKIRDQHPEPPGTAAEAQLLWRHYPFRCNREPAQHVDLDNLRHIRSSSAGRTQKSVLIKLKALYNNRNEFFKRLCANCPENGIFGKNCNLYGQKPVFFLQNSPLILPGACATIEKNGGRPRMGPLRNAESRSRAWKRNGMTFMMRTGI